MEPDNQNSYSQQAPQKAPKGYGKRPVWQWVVIYTIVAAVIYGLVYLIFFYHNGSSSY